MEYLEIIHGCWVGRQGFGIGKTLDGIEVWAVMKGGEWGGL